MRVIKVLPGQTLLDISIQETGTINNLFDIAVFNNVGITDSLTPGDEIKIPDNLTEINKNYFINRGIKPASDIIKNTEGIEFWRIENEFIVS